jgi:hypothetical protein
VTTSIRLNNFILRRFYENQKSGTCRKAIVWKKWKRPVLFSRKKTGEKAQKIKKVKYL